jgi:polysaccharide export outer membrane protein
MISFKYSSLLLAPLLLCACAGQKTTLDSSGAPTPVSSYSEPYRIAALDSFVITQKNGDITTVQVTADDSQEYPEGEPLHALGKTPDDVAAVVRKRDSSVRSVTVSEFKGNRISVTGEVNIQTNFDLQDAPMHVLDAIASAGGFTPLADTECVKLVRHSSGKVEVYSLNMHDVQHGKDVYQDLLLQPGDHIFVPRSFL